MHARRHMQTGAHRYSQVVDPGRGQTAADRRHANHQGFRPHEDGLGWRHIRQLGVHHTTGTTKLPHAGAGQPITQSKGRLRIQVVRNVPEVQQVGLFNLQWGGRIHFISPSSPIGATTGTVRLDTNACSR